MRDTTSHALALKFADMPSGIANRWLAWARSHDWCEFAGITGTNKQLSIRTPNGEYELFSNPQELRDWAGY